MAYIENFPVTVTNPDGEEIELLTSGDEFFNYLHDEYGNKIMQGEDGYYRYAYQYGEDIFPGKIKVDKKKFKSKVHKKKIHISDSSYKKRADRMYDVPELKNTGDEDGKKSDGEISFSPENSSIHLGTLNNITIFIRFADDNNTWNNSLSHYNGLLNGGRPSVRNYFDEVSYGKVDVISHLYPTATNNTILSYQDIHNRNYFLPYSSTNPEGYLSTERTEREHSLLRRAIEAIRSQIPTSMDIDGNDDGRVDSVSFICKGNATGWGSILWGHRWALFSQTVTINGKRVWDYTFQPENQATWNIISHELFHVFGAPDLYRYSGGGITPVGSWDLMASGRGHMGAHMKWKYTQQRWLENIPIITKSGKYNLNPLTSPNNNVFAIMSPNSDIEYFLVEYRKKSSETYDSVIPGSGLLVYRIHSGIHTGNRNGPPDEVYIYRPSGTLTNNGTITSAHYSDKVGRTIINNSTNPRPFLMDNTNGDLHIFNIKELSDSIEFEVYIEGTTPIENKELTLSNNPEDISVTLNGSGFYPEGTIVRISIN